MTRIGTSMENRGALLALRQQRQGVWSRVGDYVELTKPRIVALELITVAVAAKVAAPRDLNPWLLLHVISGAGLVAASAGAMNQWLERSADGRMGRTASRPLPAGRLGTTEVVSFALITLLCGALQLALCVNSTCAWLGVATWLIYVGAYTPLKSSSPINTAVGAVSGALPILIGWTATGRSIDPRALGMAGVLFLWQFPHFMAIAWLYREDYQRAGHRMLTVVDPSGVRAGAQAVIAALALIPISLLPALTPDSASPALYSCWAIAMGCAQLVVALQFLIRRDDQTARRLLRASLLYLPCWMGLLVMLAV